MSEQLRRRSVTISGHRTSVSLEDPFWEQLKGIAAERNLSIANVVAEVDKGRQSNLSSALRVFVLKELLKRQTTMPLNS
ncbi:MAG: ribbon-helix-helix domain-containing protein [Alphaproteobacteria bacterium]|nr:ribbon-helix-helix domain-containing protein [Alphaproteobacteria bacterium]MCB9928479.1 ribbon-helix-helix domain-containing protein [Alphaproteobacteria bacterium]